MISRQAKFLGKLIPETGWCVIERAVVDLQRKRDRRAREGPKMKLWRSSSEIDAIVSVDDSPSGLLQVPSRNGICRILWRTSPCLGWRHWRTTSSSHCCSLPVDSTTSSSVPSSSPLYAVQRWKTVDAVVLQKATTQLVVTIMRNNVDLLQCT